MPGTLFDHAVVLRGAKPMRRGTVMVSITGHALGLGVLVLLQLGPAGDFPPIASRMGVMLLAAAPPPAPPVSLDSLKTALAAEQARGAMLQSQLDDLMTVTDQLSAALVSTEGEVKVDGLTAKELRARLKAADAKLKTVNRLLKEAQRRLIALGAAPVKTPKPATGSGTGSGSGSGGGGGGGSSATPTPAPPAATTFDMHASVASGVVHVTWTGCSASGFDSYALVRSTDSEIHYPPEDGDTLVARIADRVDRADLDTGVLGDDSRLPGAHEQPVRHPSHPLVSGVLAGHTSGRDRRLTLGQFRENLGSRRIDRDATCDHVGRHRRIHAGDADRIANALDPCPLFGPNGLRVRRRHRSRFA